MICCAACWKKVQKLTEYKPKKSHYRYYLCDECLKKFKEKEKNEQSTNSSN